MKRNILHYRYLWIVVVLLIFGKIFLPWFVSPEIIGGDWPTYSPEFIREQKLFPSLWSTYRGVGGAVTPVLNLETFQAFLVVPWVNWFNLPWSVVYKVGCFGLFLVLGAVSSFTLSRTILFGLKRNWVHALSVLIYGTNTYVLMLVSGGQMGVGLAYALFPLVLSQFITLGRYVLLEKKLVVRQILTAGFSLSLEIVFDIRFAYLSVVAVFLYWMLLVCWQLFHRNMSEKGSKLNPGIIIVSVAVSMGLAVLLNAFWLFPTAATASSIVSELDAIYTSSSAVTFFSFADFSHALSLLHPNWPENVFGKTYFLQPEFLIIPLIAFASLLFIGKKTINNKQNTFSASCLLSIRYFTLLALLGAFLAKGANEPFGGAYLWLFDHVPGFVMFRDPTKWYVFIVISYTILVPVTMEMFIDFIKEKFADRKAMSLLGSSMRLMIVLLWLVFIRQALFGNLGGTLQIHEIPKEYIQLANVIARQPSFFRTMWVPKQPRFSPVSDLHPSFASENIIRASTAAIFTDAFDNSDTQRYLEELAVKYVVIPYDALGELFLDNRQYDRTQRLEWERLVDAIGWLKKVSSGSITVYETIKHNDHFWLTAGNISGYRMLSPDRYEITLATKNPAILYFSEGYHPGWRVSLENQIIFSSRTVSHLNSFIIPAGFIGNIQVFFYPEVYAKWGRIVSIVTFVGVAVFVILQSAHRRRSL